METVKIVDILPTEVWYEKDFLGTIRVKMKHHGIDDPFTFITIGYDYMYTSNAHQYEMVKKIGKLLGVEDIQSRESTENW